MVPARPVTPSGPSSISMSGLSSSKLTAPGPRNLRQVTVSTGSSRPEPSPSSPTQTSRASGSPATTVRSTTAPEGPENPASAGSNLTTGGPFPGLGPAAARNGSIRYSLSRLTGISRVSPREVRLQVTSVSASGTVTVNTPIFRRGKKYVGWPWSSGPGATRLSGPTGMVTSSTWLRLK